MTAAGAEFWTDDTSVLFTSFWGWNPDTWGAMGWTGPQGKSRRDNLLPQLSDPFITVVYATSNKTDIDPDLKGMIAGFYLVSHERGHRDAFTHPIHHKRYPDKWEHSLRALRAFNYLPEYRMSVADLDPRLINKARAIAAMGTLITDREMIAKLRDTPWHEVDIYTPGSHAADEGVATETTPTGGVKAGPASEHGYVVSEGTKHLKRQLYVLRLHGDTAAFVGQPCPDRSIYKVGLSVSPDSRRQQFQKAMPKGAFTWCIEWTSAQPGLTRGYSFSAAVTGEDAMKRHLVESGATWLGGEFYLADQRTIEAAWKEGLQTADQHPEEVHP